MEYTRAVVIESPSSAVLALDFMLVRALERRCQKKKEEKRYHLATYLRSMGMNQYLITRICS